MIKMELRKDVLVVPYQTPWVGGAEDAPSYAQVVSGKMSINEFPGGESIERLSGTYLYGGPLKVHFGHVVVDTIPRLYAYDPRRHRGVIFAVLLEDRPVPQWVYDIFELFGLPGDAVCLVRHPTTFETVEFVEPGTLLGPTPRWYLDYLAKVDYQHHQGTPPQIYLGRSHIAHKGMMMGETYFAGLLTDFEYVRPEEHAISVQMSMLANASRIVFAEGSAIFSVCLLPRIDATVFMLPRRPGRSQLFSAQFIGRSEFHVLGDKSQIVRLANTRGRQHPNSPGYTLSPESIHADMYAHGLTCADFDLDRFLEAERCDAENYFGSAHEDLMEAQLEEIRHLRSTQAVKESLK